MYMRQVDLFKVNRLTARVVAQQAPEKVQRIKARRREREFNRDVDVAYAVMLERVNAHNVATCAFAARASPVIH